MDDAEMMAQMGMPMSFGKKVERRQVNLAERLEKAKRQDKPKPKEQTPEVSFFPSPKATDFPPLAPGPSKTKLPLVPDTRPENKNEGPRSEEVEDDEDGEDAYNDDDESDDGGSRFPVSHELTLKDHNKVVSAIALDPSGARIASGSHDYDCKLWDFGGMNAGLKPFKSWEPAGTYYVHDLKYSNDGNYLLVISGTLQPLVFDKNAENHDTYPKGDQYIRDMKRTDGHVGELTSGAWHPKDANTFITSSNDSTVRIWDVENRMKQKTVIVVKSKERGTRTKITACNYSYDGKLVVNAGLDGTLHLWATSGTYARPSSSIENAHAKGSETGSVLFSRDGNCVLSRGGDGTIKLWDVRKFKTPLFERGNLPLLYSEGNAMFSPDERNVILGRSATSRTDKGGLVILSREGLDEQQRVDCDPGVSVVRVFWHSKINQIVAGLSNGEIKVLYSPRTSLNGAKLVLTKSAKKLSVEDVMQRGLMGPILTPHALPGFRDDGEIRAGGAGGKRKREKERMDKRKTKRPEAPLNGPGRGGRVGASATQHIVQHLVRDSTRDQDPREALLKYADTEKNPMWTKAWQQNQPKPVFAEEEEEEENE
ncbi:WD40-repeat-containing domain protein [Cantharellus anzutake]|uniref:WD40-repeat-containing domain protein n=1 Tax=Cantharellus anzutake TaxID=1750568 RepID=UPI00190563A3|nr:WD40-repeat-containing domain protein [Cantharellus anzutake]KAF8338314.1 WD40-repeat-containing domain protein [Cantharellus anzutake]